MSGCSDNCGLCSVCTLSAMEQKCDALAAERDALRARVAELEGALKPFAFTADGIPDNWPGEVGLTWDVYDGREPRADGQEMAQVSFKYSAIAILPVAIRGVHPKISEYRRARSLLG